MLIIELQNRPAELIEFDMAIPKCRDLRGSIILLVFVMARPFDLLLSELRTVYENHQELMAFAPFCQDVTTQKIEPNPLLCGQGLAREKNEFFETQYQTLCKAVVAAGAQAHWRETYKHTKVGQDFLDRFGCFTIIGPEGGFQSGQLWAWVVYMPPRLYYPWHEHPTEECYLVIAGEAQFMRAGQAPRFLHSGDVIFHAAQQPHALQTHEAGVLALVFWRNGFGILPVLSEDTL